MSARTFPSFRHYLGALKRDPRLAEFDLTASGAARACKVSRAAVTNWIGRGKLDAVRIETHIVLVRSKDLSEAP